ncbi:MAG: hypothetical protein M1830_003993 [Pleopsidium flavum]|nr:MAG: hypothetical protein M1830_003993 [Pleopsidium flavum]
MEDTNPELERFRNQWREEVTARAKGVAQNGDGRPSRSSGPAKSSIPHTIPPPPLSAVNASDAHDEDEVDGVDQKGYHDLVNKDDLRRLGDGQGEPSHSGDGNRQPRSALEHYEKAVEKETQGSLGDSLSLYRKAYRLDYRVDQTYKNKHFPTSSSASKPANLNPSNVAVTVPNPAHHSLQGPSTSIQDLIASFSALSMPAESPSTERSPAPPCPIAIIPSEVLIEILQHIAIIDVASFARLAQVCKRLAYLVTTEDRIWKRVCCGDEVGFGAMHYDWTCDIHGHTLGDDGEGGYILGSTSTDLNPKLPTSISLADNPLTLSLLHKTYASTWRLMFRTRPRIRFNGCYISTVNYVRPGASSPTQISWNTPVHIVTYYRYLRFFRDGTAVSLLTTAEPADVVHYLTKENMHTHHSGALPSAVMKPALRGRWRLSGPGTGLSTGGASEVEGNVHVETEGVDIKYMYKMHFSLRSAGRGAKNNKMSWRGFWSYNKLTDDWAEFALRNDRAFFWSRVRSYGVGY